MRIMKGDNKIVCLNKFKEQNDKRKCINKYNFVMSITIEIFENNGRYSYDYYTYPEDFPKREIIKILNKIYLRVSKVIPELQFEFRDALNLGRFTIIYLENKKDPKDFKFLCTNPRIDDWKLYIILSIIKIK